MPSRVILDVFSGQPNPEWELDAFQDAEFLSHLDALQPVAGKAVREVREPPLLGFRGFIVQASSYRCRGPIRIYGGIVRCTDKEYADPARQVERWLLGTAGASLQPHLRAMIEREIEGR